MESVSDIQKGCGSKYIPSDLSETFLRVNSDLENGEIVLFVGTPCQCGALLNFVGDKSSLYCIDFVCHGVPSPHAFDSYIQSQELIHGKILSVNMRDKTTGWSKYSYCWKIKSKTGEFIQKQNENAFMKGFVSNLYLRPSCSSCAFKGTNRQTDITLGDYWGAWDIQPELDDNKGTSLLLIHTEKGQELFERISDNIVKAPAPIESAVTNNPSLVASSHPSSKREKFFRLITEGEDFIKIVEELTMKSVVDRAKGKIKTIIKKIRLGRSNI